MLALQSMKQFIFLLWITFSTTLYAQQGLVTAGGNSSGTAGSVNYSIGQPFNTSIVNNLGSLSEGMQQPYEILVVTQSGDMFHRLITCSAYPNPTRDKIMLRVDELEFKQLSFQLFDTNGKLLLQDTIINQETTIEITGYLSGIYFLKVSDQQKNTISFKIIKY